MSRVEIFAILGTLGLLVLVFEAVRRRRLSEGYSLLWLLTGVVLLGLSLWREGLHLFSKLVGIFYPPAALFVVGFALVTLTLFQFSIVISRLSDQNRKLAQEMALLRWQMFASQTTREETLDRPISQKAPFGP
jgi:hypothetical protein